MSVGDVHLYLVVIGIAYGHLFKHRQRLLEHLYGPAPTRVCSSDSSRRSCSTARFSGAAALTSVSNAAALSRLARASAGRPRFIASEMPCASAAFRYPPAISAFSPQSLPARFDR